MKIPKPASEAYPTELITLGDHLRAKRLDLGLLQREVAQRLKTTTNSVTNWEKNRYEPSLPFVPRIIEFVGYVLESLVLVSQELGERIVAYRKVTGLSQKKLARRLRIDPGTLSKWEKGKKRPSQETVEKLKSLLDSLPPDAELVEILSVILEI